MSDDQTLAVTHSTPSIVVRSSATIPLEKVFTGPFSIGRGPDCDLRAVDRTVSKQHAEVRWEAGQWWIIDLKSQNGTFVNGERIDRVTLQDGATLELGPGGPVIQVVIHQPWIGEGSTVATPPASATSATVLVKRWKKRRESGETGEQTRIFHEAISRITAQHSRIYRIALVVGLLLLVGAGVVVWKQHGKLEELRATAAEIFYAMKQLELQVAQLEELVQGAKELEMLVAKRQALQTMETRYDEFLNQIGMYSSSMSEQDRAIFSVVRTFGECEATMPKAFLTEVKKYIKRWQNTGLIKASLRRAVDQGVVQLVSRHMSERNLPQEFLYLALQESGFNPRAVGPKTRMGYAKGMWQFLEPTAEELGLKPGPLKDRGEYDADDERFDIAKSSEAAARYIKRLYTTDAQASGLLVMAAYNWGEGHVLKILRQMPKNPKERNFWALLKQSSIPRETYDYVFSIVAAAVIGDQPKLFGFDFQNPLQTVAAGN